MNYYLIKNKYEVLKYNYPDKFDINIYYLSNNYCRIFVKRIDVESGWGLDLHLKLFDINNNDYNIVIFGNSNENTKSILYNTTFNLEYKNDIIEIPNIIYPINDLLLKNKYNIIINENYDINDYHIVLYYIDEYRLSIIIRKLDCEKGWNDIGLKIIIEDIENKNIKELINIENSEMNFKYLQINTKIKLDKINNDYKQEIPKIIFQTGNNKYFKDILHFNSIISFIELNPEYTYMYFNDIQSRKFLKENYSDDIINAYDMLVPGAYKSDLFRYCILYFYGGCYFDCKQILKKSIRNFLDNNKTVVLCKDIIDKSLFNGVLFTTKKNIIFNKIIKDCVYNISNKKGTNPFDITGSMFLYKSIKKYINNENLLLKNNKLLNNFIEINNDYKNSNITLIKTNDIILYRYYNGYYINYLETNNYGKLFNSDEIYYKNFQNINNIKICVFPNLYCDKFLFKIANNKLYIKRSDSNNGWNFNLKLLIINDKNEEKILNVGVSYNNIKEISL
jgi:mannosyltransferase OCH1-like enzyme